MKTKFKESYASCVLTPMNMIPELDLAYARAKLKKGLLYKDSFMKLSNLGYAYLLTIAGKNYQVYTRQDINGVIDRVAKGVRS